ncbi:MAG: IS1182 family transposase [Stigonema ocellatum SAG 48.90 = DSM 106950]|uniref:IS1182 family transposase n=1 Tax=Spirosoma sp. TaxID=1899569 RepID=UPI00261F5147|nr:IS1182 family transposase [Spirosoma sp.]MBR8841165.1 IS1182 family transposase [Stigonema ocellatum SAG 48.90 = DSM 106950]MCX6213699.1 IS1182 family transposase [Spirosoma sp.]
MQGKKDDHEKLVTHFQLSSRIPKGNFYRRLKEMLDLTFLYEHTKACYGSTGNPSIDPVVFFKFMLIGHLENITSDRKLIEHCSMRMDMLYFLGYNLDEPLPWHSTLSRTRQLYPEVLFELLFDKVFSLCVANSMVAGRRVAIDSAPVKANASMERLLEKQPNLPGPRLVQSAEVQPKTSIVTPSPRQAAPVITAADHQLRQLKKRQQNLKHAPTTLGAGNEKAKLLSNKTHYSPADPDARISIKPGKARKLNYHCSLAVDTAEGIISHVQADFADGRDSQNLPDITLKLQQRLANNELCLEEILADSGYSNGANYALLEQWNITGWIPVFGQYKPQIEGFPYAPESDRFICSQGKHLMFKTFDKTADGGWLKVYRADYKDCQQCPLKSTCVPKSQCRQIIRTAYDPFYRRALERQQSRRGKRMARLRHQTVEPVLGSLVDYYGLRKVNVRGKTGVHKVMLMAAVGYNLKKYMKFTIKSTVSQAIALKVEWSLASGATLLSFPRLFLN